MKNQRRTVTLLFSDVEGSTALLRELRERYGEVLAEHQRLLRSAFDAHGGEVVDTQGDSFFVAFATAHNAVAAAVAAQRALAQHRWREGVDVKVRIGVHTGEPEWRGERYVGLDVHRAARIAAAAHGGQVLLSSATRDLIEHDLPDDEALRDLGEQRLKDLDQPEHLHQLLAGGLRSEFPPPRTLDAEAAAGRRVRRRALLLAATVGALAAAIAIPMLALGGDEGDGAALERISGNAAGRVEAATGRITAAAPLPSVPGAAAAGDGAIWVLGSGSTLWRLDPDSGSVVQTVTVGPGGGGIAVGGGSAWVTSRGDGTLSRIDLATNQVVQVIPAGNAPGDAAVGGGSVWVVSAADQNVTRVDLVTGRVEQRIATGAPGTGIAFANDAVWVSSGSAGTVARIDFRTGRVVAAVNVGNGPRAIAAGHGAVWVANSLDGTVSRIDPGTGAVRATIPVGRSPSALALAPGAVWVANELSGTLSRIDARTNRVDGTVVVGGRVAGVVHLDGALFVSVRAAGGHRGGTLRVHQPAGAVGTVDPARAYSTWAIQLLGLTGDGLVAFKRVGGPDGSTLVPALALAIPRPTDGGRTYAFQLRRGLRYSDGRPVRASDVRATIERVFRARSPRGDLYTGLVGGASCLKRPAGCDLSRGIVADDRAGTVVFRLVAPDPEFLDKLALWFAFVLPKGTPATSDGPFPATGPYMIASFDPARGVRLVRNPHFRAGSRVFRPAGYADEIRVEFVPTSESRLRGEVEAVKRGQLDVAADVPPGSHDALRARYASQVHELRLPITVFVVLDTDVPPFDKRDARRALAYALDRAAAARGLIAQPACQALPPSFPGYVPYCPYTKGRGTTWVAPDLERARALVARSGTRGLPVQVTTPENGPDRQWAGVVAAALRRIGYEATVRVLPDAEYWEAIQRKESGIRAATMGWVADWPTPAGFLATLFGCHAFGTYVCDRKLDTEMERAVELGVEDPAGALALWARVDRRITDEALWVPLVNMRGFAFVSERLGNEQFHILYGLLLDQAWVR